MSLLRCSLILSMLTTACLAEDATGKKADAEAENAGNIEWLADYGEAMKIAKSKRSYLVVLFGDGTTTSKTEAAIESLMKKKRILRRHTFVRVPRSYQITSGGKKVTLLQHGAFNEMQGSDGLAIIDLANPKSKQHGYVISVVPYLRGVPTENEFDVLFNLPRGTLTQRTLIFAVRTHPELPQSTSGKLSNVLLGESESHSNHQANITLQGHHNWDNRFHRINSRLPGMLAQEVVAESWPGQGLLAAARECVHSWRQSSGHWSAVRSRQNMFGYDMKRGRNGTWYATGIFAKRR